MNPEVALLPENWQKIKNPPNLNDLDLDEHNAKEILDTFTKNGSTYVLNKNHRWSKLENINLGPSSKAKKVKKPKKVKERIAEKSDNVIVQVVKWSTPTKEKVTTIPNTVITEPMSPNSSFVGIVD